MVNAGTEEMDPSEARCDFVEAFGINVTQQHFAIANRRIEYGRKIRAAGLILDFRVEQLDPAYSSFDSLTLTSAEPHGTGDLHELAITKSRLCYNSIR